MAHGPGVYEKGYTDSRGTERKTWVLRITGDQTAGQDIKTKSRASGGCRRMLNYLSWPSLDLTSDGLVGNDLWRWCKKYLIHLFFDCERLACEHCLPRRLTNALAVATCCR